jgi:hypothetical protein
MGAALAGCGPLFSSVDEIWIHHYMPEMKEESKQWSSPGKQAPKKANTVPSAGNVTATVSKYEKMGR